MGKVKSGWEEVMEIAQGVYDLDSDLTKEAYDHEAAMAEINGFEVIIRKPDQLLLDLDSELARSIFYSQSERMGAILDGHSESWPSKTPGHDHLLLGLRAEVTPLEAIALQAMLGSDPMREYLNLLRLRNEVEEPTRLFRPKTNTIIHKA